MNYSMQMIMLAQFTPMKKYSIQLTITSNAYATYGMSVNKNKTKLIVQLPHKEDMPNRNITNGDVNIKQTELIPYLGSILSVQGTSSKDVENRIQAAFSAFGKL